MDKFLPLSEFMTTLENMSEGLSYCSKDCLFKRVPPSAKVVRLGGGKAHTEYAIFYEQKMLLQCCPNKRSSLHPLGQYELSFSYRDAYRHLANTPQDNVVPVFDACDCAYEIAFISGNVLYDAGTIPQWLRYEFKTRIMMEHGYSWKSWSSWMRGLISGLRHLHRQGMAHGDVMPFNVMITDDNKNAIWIDLENISYDPVQIRRDSISFLFNVFGFSLLAVTSYPKDFFAQLTQILKETENCEELLAVLEKLLQIKTRQSKSSSEEEMFSLFVNAITDAAEQFIPQKCFYEINDVFLMNFWGMRQYFKSANLFSKQGDNISLERQKIYWRDKEIQRLMKNFKSADEVLKTLENQSLTVYLYFDVGSGLNEADKLEATIDYNDCGCKIVFELKKYINVHVVRLDPGEAPIILRLNGVIINDGTSEVRLSSNGMCLDNDFVFTVPDPQVTVESPEPIQKIVFDCDFVRPLPLEAAVLFNKLTERLHTAQVKGEDISKQLQSEQAKASELANKLQAEKKKSDEIAKCLHIAQIRNDDISKQLQSEQAKSNHLVQELSDEQIAYEKHIVAFQEQIDTLKKTIEQTNKEKETLAQIEARLPQSAKSEEEKRNLERYLCRQFRRVSFRNIILPICVKIARLIFSGKIFRAKQLLDAYVTIHRSEMFDSVYYIEQYKDISSVCIHPLLHYLLWGSSKGWNPNALFDTNFYLAQHHDVAGSGMNPLLHYIRYGRDAGYKTSPALNPSLPTDEKFHSFSCSLRYFPGISIIIPTYNGGPLFQKVLDAIANQDFAGSRELIVVDSGSTDGTDKLAERYGAIVKRISKEEFHHSRTRQWALQFAQYDRVVYMVQDAIPISKTWLQILHNTLSEKVAAAYGRQIPHEDADLYARFETNSHSGYLGNVPRIQCISSNKKRSYQDELYRCRFDNACSIYWHKELEDIPFPDTPYAEDMAWAQTAMHKGMSIYYSPDIQIRHSHNRSPEYRFKRTIVDIVICAKILNQVERDLRPADMSEIKILEEFCKQLLDEKMLKFDSSPHPRIRSFKKTIWEQAFAKSLKYIGKSSSQVVSVTESYTSSLLSLIAEHYPEATDAEFRMCIPQAIAVSHGATVGGIYASYLLNGGMPSDLEEYVRSLMKGI